MAWDLATAKQYLGIAPADESQDAAITVVMAFTLASIEKALARKLLELRERITLYDVVLPRVFLPRYPVTEVHTVDGVVPDSEWVVNPSSGYVQVTSDGYYKTLSVDYTGGFDPLPADLERAMWSAFMAAWAQTDGMTGGPSATADSGAVKSLTVFDAFKVDYDTGAAFGDWHARWGWLAPWALTFELYRSDAAMGVV